MNHSQISLIGTYTRKMGHVHGKARGIRTVSLNTNTGELEDVCESDSVPNSSYLCLGKTGEMLYSINEICDFAGSEDGSLTALKVDGNHLKISQTISAGGMGPAYISIDQTGQWLLCANYVGGNILVVNIRKDGSFGDITENVKLYGSGPNKNRQEAPHPHSILTSPDNRFVYAVDLGSDLITGYHFNATTGRLKADEKLKLYAGPGTGPRHLIFHPNTNYAFFVKELTSELSICSLDASSGKLSLLNTTSTLPEGFKGESHCSELCISKCGSHLYVANRGHDSIAIFHIQNSENGDELDGIQLIGHSHCLGHIPRHISLSPCGKYLLVANQESNQLNCLLRDPVSGLLTPTEHSLDIPTPAFIEFVG